MGEHGVWRGRVGQGDLQDEHSSAIEMQTSLCVNTSNTMPDWEIRDVTDEEATVA